MIIDFHTHSFPEKICHRVVEHLSDVAHISYFTDGSIPGLLESMRRCQVDYSVNFPVMTRPDQVVSINDKQIRHSESLFEKGIISFGGMHPDYPDIKKELRRLKDHGIVGIKLHPAYQETDIEDIRMKRIIAEASALDMVVLIHAGIDVGLCDHDYAPVSQILSLIDEIHPSKLVLAHMGGWGAWDDVARYLAGAPVWLDTSFSIGPVIKKFGQEDLLAFDDNLSLEDFTALCKLHGTERILFATDSPWSEQAIYTNYIMRADFSDEEKEHILWKNAVDLLEIPALTKKRVPR